MVASKSTRPTPGRFHTARARIALAKARLAAERGAAEIADLHLRDAMQWIRRARQAAEVQS